MSGADSVFEAIGTLSNKVSIASTDIGGIKKDVEWIKKGVEDISAHQKACTTCTNSKYISEQTDRNRDDIQKLQDDRNVIYGVSIALAILINIAGFYIQGGR